MTNFFKKRWYLFLVAILVLIFIFYRFNVRPKTIEKSYKVKIVNLKEELSFSGQIDATEKVTLRFQTSGRLAWVGIKEGDYVKKYQVLASLDKRDIKNRLQKYLNVFVSQRLNFEQTKDDYWNKQYDLSESIRKSAQRTLEDSQYDLNNSILDVELQNLSLEYANLWTPIEGVVTKVSTPFSGVNITPAQGEFEIVNPKTLYFSATADQTEIIKLKQGQRGKIILDSYPEEEIEGEIYWISFAPKTNETGTVYELKTKFDFVKPLKLGMSGDINFVTKERKRVIALPATFIKKDKKGDYVNVQKDSRSVKRYIKKGEEIEGKIIIKEGLEEGEIVIN